MRSRLPSAEAIRIGAARWLLQGISPERLAVTLALGFVIGFLPIIGIPTALCVLVAMAFRLNQPAIQAANYAAMPFQLALLVPFVKLGGKLTPSLSQGTVDLATLSRSPWQLMQHQQSSTRLASQLGVMAGQALLAWVVVAVPIALILTVAFTSLLRRVPLLAQGQAGD